jgi:hypothetical protein
VPKTTGRWFEFSAEHEVGFIRDERILVITMSNTSGVEDGVYGFVVAESGREQTGTLVGIIT